MDYRRYSAPPIEKIRLQYGYKRFFKQGLPVVVLHALSQKLPDHAQFSKLLADSSSLQSNMRVFVPAREALALFRLIFAACFFVLGTYALVRFYRSRWVLDIRTR